MKIVSVRCLNSLWIPVFTTSSSDWRNFLSQNYQKTFKIYIFLCVRKKKLFLCRWKIFNLNFMCTLLTDPYCAKIKFYRKPRYTHFCSVWNIILSSLYQKCRIWIQKKIIRKKINHQNLPTKSLNWSKIRHWNFTWLLVNRRQKARRWKAIGSRRMVTLNHRIR